MTRLLTTAAVAAALALPAYAQGREDTVVFDLDRTIADPENFNPFTPGTKRQHGAHQAMWEPLFILNYTTGELDPWLATSMEPNEDATEWTLMIREGVTWSDGEAFDADDVVFTVQMALDNPDLSEREPATIRAQVGSVEKVDDLTVRFTLNEANPRFAVENFGVRIFGSLVIVPEHVWAGEDPATYPFFPPIGTGPYEFESAATNRAIWSRDDDWWGAASGFMDLPEPERLVWLESGGEESRAQLLATGQLDAGHSVSLGTFEAIQAQNPAVIAWTEGLPYAWPDPCARQLEINTTVAPWDDPNMRRALSLLIDREQIVNVAYEGTTSPSRSMFVQYGSMEPFIAAVEEAGYGLSPNADVEEAKRLIEAAGYVMEGDTYVRDGQPLTASIHVNSASPEYTRTIDVVVEQLQRAGIDARAVPVENGVFWGEVLPLGGYEISYSWLSCGSVNEPWTSMTRYTNDVVAPIGERAPGFNNTQRWDTNAATEYTGIVSDIGGRALDDPELPALVASAYEKLDAEVPFVPLVQAAKLLPYSTQYWTGWPTEENAYNHPAHWWQTGHQIIHNLTRAE